MTEECGLLNLASCIPEKIYEFILNIINAPIKPLLDLTKSLLVEPIRIDTIAPVWAIIIYILSLFYGLLILYSGFNFMISGYDAVKRAKAKQWFQNIFVMIVLVQCSYFLYYLCVDVSSLMTAGVINLVDENFFLLTADNITNIGLQFFFGIFYLFAILISVLLLTLRYLFVLAGLVFFPIGIFLYFIPATQEYGKVIFNSLGVYLLVPFFDGLIFLICSRMLEIPAFENFKILVMISAFSIVNFLMFYLIIFSLIKSAIKASSENIKVIGTIAKLAT
ncbi:MAG: hypothetical protein WCI72_06260 [archaeon]